MDVLDLFISKLKRDDYYVDQLSWCFVKLMMQSSDRRNSCRGAVVVEGNFYDEESKAKSLATFVEIDDFKRNFITNCSHKSTFVVC